MVSLGYVCGLADCTAPAGVSESDNCPTGYYLCPSPYNYGCCQTTMGCALNACYATTPSTFVFTATFTTKTGRTGKPVITTVTSTTVETPTVPSGLPDDTNIYIPKFIPTTQAKASEVAVASNSTESSSSGLTKPQIGGLIGGLMALLVIVVVAAVFIIRSLQKTSKAVKRAERRNTGGAGTGNSSRHTPKDSGGGGGGTRPPKMQPTPSQINQMEYNDLLENVHSESPLPPSGPRKPNMSSTSGSTPVPPFPSAHGKISSDFSSPSNGVDGEPVTGYFDTPTSSQSRPGHVSVSTDVRTSTDSQNQRQRYRSRIASNASELSGESNVVGSPLQPAELGVDGGFIPELPPSTTGGFMHAPYVPHAPQTIQPLGQAGVDPEMQQPLMTGHARDWSGSSATTSAYAPNYAPGPAAGYAPGYAQGHSRERSNSSQQTQHHQQPPRLTAVAEAAENLHGHYGPTNLAVGQTQTYTENGNGEGPANAQ